MNRCEICDREECQREAARRDLNRATIESGNKEYLRAREADVAAAADCEAHRVDWRARALAAEAVARLAEADREDLRAQMLRERDVLQRLAARAMDEAQRLSGGDAMTRTKLDDLDDALARLRHAIISDLDDALARMRHALCAAEDALRLARIERTAERADIVEYFYCADCAVEVYADEDGCCATCGADCEIRPGTGPHDTEGKR